jgi:hypothetical protein
MPQIHTRARAIRPNRDENAISKHTRQSSSVTSATNRNSGVFAPPTKAGANSGASKLPSHIKAPSGPAGKGLATAGLAVRPALNEVTTNAVNRKQPSHVGGKEPLVKSTAVDTLKRARGSSISDAQQPARRVPLAQVAKTRQSLAPRQSVTHGSRSVPQPHGQKASRIVVRVDADELAQAQEELDMDVEGLEGAQASYPTGMDSRALEAEYERALDGDNSLLVGEQEVEALVCFDGDGDVEVVSERDDREDVDQLLNEEEEETAKQGLSRDEVDTDAVQAELERVWPDMPTAHRRKCEAEVQQIRETFPQDDLEVGAMDPSMVSEYADEIFEYMQELEEEMMPSSNYMDAQGEINWSMRQTLVDWLLQVHLR